MIFFTDHFARWAFIVGVGVGVAAGAYLTERWWFLVNRLYPRQRAHRPHLGCCRLPLGLGDVGAKRRGR